MLELESRNKILKRIIGKFEDVYKTQKFVSALNVERKADRSIVTDIDHFVSREVKSVMQDWLDENDYNFFSEEEMSEFKFPMVVLDPIDGTRELAKGMAECVLSLAIMKDATQGYGWLYNPFTGFSISTDESFVIAPNFNREDLTGMVSRSEYKKGVFKDIQCEGLTLVPRGSIAFKLGLLASGSCDFVYSKSPKNIWDIAAGTLVCKSRGVRLYQKGIEITSLYTERIDGELIWCRPEQLEYISKRLYK